MFHEDISYRKYIKTELPRKVCNVVPVFPSKRNTNLNKSTSSMYFLR